MFYGNFYLQGARGMTALHTGLVFIPGALGVVFGSAIGNRLVRRYGVAAVCGGALTVVAAAFVANLAFDLDTPLLYFCLLGAVNGTAMGATIAPTVSAVIAVLPIDRMGAGSAVNNTVRQVGSVLGIAVLGTVLTTAYRDRVSPALAGLPAAARSAAQSSAEQTRAVAEALGRPDLVATANRTFIAAMHLTAVTAGLVALAGAVLLALAFRKRPAAPQAEAEPAAAPEPSAAGR